MAAHLYATTGQDDARLFAIADYLQHGLRNGALAIGYAEEAQLLRSYVELLSLVKGSDGITLDVQQAPSPGNNEVPRHLSCELLALLLKTLPVSQARDPLHVRLSPLNGSRGAVLVIECVADERQRTVQGLETELRSWAERLQAQGWQVVGTTGAGQADALVWTVSIQKRALP